MAARFEVFIASSTEGLEAAQAVHAILHKHLGKTGHVTLWNRAFIKRSFELAEQQGHFQVGAVSPAIEPGN